MVARTEYPDPAAAQPPETIARNRRLVDREFWTKLRKFAARIPFAEELAAAWFCVVDSDTPASAKGILIAALAYFVSPVDIIPDFIGGFGFTDDAAVLAMAIAAVSRHLKPEHYARARAALGVAETSSSGKEISEAR
jgi:uncharacterized membrane protein YkvA (DUF1232 family)